MEDHILDLSSTGDTGGYAEWFTGSCGGTSIGTGNSITVTPASTKTYYVRYTNSCGSTATCLSRRVTVNANLSVVSITPNEAKTICDADSGTLLTAAETDGGVITAHQWGKHSRFWRSNYIFIWCYRLYLYSNRSRINRRNLVYMVPLLHQHAELQKHRMMASFAELLQV